jgi:hypothetical protein
MNRKKYLPIALGLAFLLAGIALIWLSIQYESIILTFISLAITLWGSLLLCVGPTRDTTLTLLDTTALSPLEGLNQLINSLDYKGKPIYMPPQSPNDPKSEHLFITKNANIVSLLEKKKTQNDSPFKDGISITPPGLALANLFEKKLGKKFAKVTLGYLAENLPKVFIEDLELAKKCELSIENNLVTAKLTGVTHDFLCQKLHEKPNLCNSIGCPFSSAIACALTRSTRKPVIITESNFLKKNKVLHVTYKLLGD